VTEDLLAHVDAEEGREDRAIERYRALVDETGAPEFMDHLAALIAEREPEEAKSLIERSHRIYEERLARLPEATHGHALEHYLRWAPDPERAVELAEKNVAERPNGEARTLLAQAYIRAGRIREAWDESQRVVGSKWVSAEAFATAAVAARLADDPGAAELEAAARDIDHHAITESAWLKPL
jgi:tetratricopeptide (TPR) repeat protein